MAAALLPCAFITVVVLLLMLLAAVGSSDSASACTSSTAEQPKASKNAENSIPANYLALYRSAGSRYDIPWNVLAGIGKVETGHGTSNLPGVHSGENYAGAGGPMQFIQSTWDSFGVDGDGDGKTDRYNPADAIPGAANYLHHNHANEGGEQLRKAIFQYNHSWDYVNLVLSWAKKYADGNFSVSGNNDAGATCLPGGDVPAGPTGNKIVDYAMKWLKAPYLWGAGGYNGPTGRGCAYGKCGPAFDCSGLTMYAVYQATGGKIKLDHYTGSQERDPHGTRVTFAQLQPGDLVFFTSRGKTVSHHVGIYVGGGKMVNAPHTGDWVRVSSITTGSYRSEFSGGMRFSVPSDGQR